MQLILGVKQNRVQFFAVYDYFSLCYELSCVLAVVDCMLIKAPAQFNVLIFSYYILNKFNLHFMLGLIINVQNAVYAAEFTTEYISSIGGESKRRKTKPATTVSITTIMQLLSPVWFVAILVCRRFGLSLF